MKKFIVIAILALVVAASTSYAAPKKQNRGQCVSDCVQAFNKSYKDKGDDADKKLIVFAQQECASWCKDEYVAGDGYFWDDGVCNEKYAAKDPDCEKESAGWKLIFDSCGGDFECQSDNCAYLWGNMRCWFPKI
jgi:hypothetical protein